MIVRDLINLLEDYGDNVEVMVQHHPLDATKPVEVDTVDDGIHPETGDFVVRIII